ncbi:hypothetical protein G8J24_05170 [Staphylococcus warneri]|uniref:Pathogenicity island protein n=1 Tax=Staphylococcus warneri TaxID=1292 RepID=A0ABS9NFD5_STAWA|nr:hypothetical protein [Staphylococcus warneri]MCG6208988.1 hypothetical protein [Staphylococcus warneri]MCG6225260.1 hypothetical protein [Staphylococcus warneri]MCG6246125.1 hypothetical protein [Staphylococcus warneri]MCG6248500.1 hypothetical protein [Staphylococcus warneri]MCG6250871.1 hypothetical protein [Staphylococcus warneri]
MNTEFKSAVELIKEFNIVNANGRLIAIKDNEIIRDLRQIKRMIYLSHNHFELTYFNDVIEIINVISPNVEYDCKINELGFINTIVKMEDIQQSIVSFNNEINNGHHT